MSSQSELVEAIIELNNMGDNWDAQHIGELVADWHNKQTLELLDELEGEANWQYPENDDILNAIELERVRLRGGDGK